MMPGAVISSRIGNAFTLVELGAVGTDVRDEDVLVVQPEPWDQRKVSRGEVVNAHPGARSRRSRAPMRGERIKSTCDRG
jgi:hypothetical protein